MASYHLSAQVITRGTGRSAVAAAAYRSRSAIADKKQGLTFDYTKKRDLAHSEVCLPKGAPEKFRDRNYLWNEVERMEVRKDAQLAREINVALPKELNLEQQINLVEEFVAKEFTSQGMIADVNIHSLENNPHAHIMLTMRELQNDGFGKKVREWNNRENLHTWRKDWAEINNQKLKEAGFDVTVDHRSYKERGIDLIPQKHIGYNIKFRPKNYLGLLEVQKDNLDNYILTRHINGQRIIDSPETALSYLTHYNVSFKEEDIDRFLEGNTFEKEQFDRAKSKLVNTTELVRIGLDERGEQLFTTQTMIDKEEEMILSAGRMQEKENHLITVPIYNQTLANYSLTAEQAEAMRYIVGGKDISVVLGAAGTGKSYTLAAVREAYEAEGYRVQGMALSGIAAENLENSSGIKSQTLFSKLSAWDQGKDLPTAQDIYVVDEAGFVGTRQMHQIINEVSRAGGKIILSGDMEQLPAIEAGGSARAIMERVGYMELSQVRRQKIEWQAKATQLMSSKNNYMGKVIDRYADSGNIIELQTREKAQDGLIDDWSKYVITNPEKSAVILTYTNKDVERLNQLARTQIREAGLLGNREVTVKTEKGIRAFAEGDRIIFLENNRGMSVKNGSLGTIERIGPDRSFLVRLDKGKTVAFDSRQYKNIDHGYAMTVHKAQGTTVDRSFVLATKRFDKHVAYVSLSRHRDDVTMYYGRDDFKDRTALKEAVEKRNIKSLVKDFADHRGYEANYYMPDFPKSVHQNKEWFVVPKGTLPEPLHGHYQGETQYQGKTWHRIKNDDGERFLIPSTAKLSQKDLLLERVDYNGKDLVKSAIVTRSPIKDKLREKTMELGRFLGL